MEPTLIMGLLSIKGIGNKRVRRLGKKVSTVAELQQLSSSEIGNIFGHKNVAAVRCLDWQTFENNYKKIVNHYQVISIDSDSYPEELRNTDNPPLLLYVKGTLEKKDSRAIAIVGTRKASSYGKKQAHLLACELVNHGITIVSGLAYGIDIVAHNAAVISGGRTIAVLGCGIDNIYPRHHQSTALEIIKNGACISEYIPGTPPLPHHFPERNRIVAGLSLGIIVIEAPIKSGALITAYIGLEMGKEIFAVPGNIDNTNSHGCHKLIQQGAKLIHSIDDVLEELPELAKEKTTKVVVMSKVQQKIWGVLSKIPQPLEDIINQTQLPVAKITSELMLMAMDGIVFCANKRYCRSNDWLEIIDSTEK